MPMRSHLALRPKFLTCSICNEAVELETAKIDAAGKPVHEECYVQKIGGRTVRPPSSMRTHLTMTQNLLFECPCVTCAGLRSLNRHL
jgi:hypothetical protein